MAVPRTIIWIDVGSRAAAGIPPAEPAEAALCRLRVRPEDLAAPAR